jgi:hypothetical protein
MANMENMEMVQEEVREERDILLRIAVIGTGNCGGMLVNDACNELGIDGIAINGADRDLKLITAPNAICFSTGDGKGTGKDRETAKRFFVDDSGLLLDDKCVSVIENNDVIIVATSASGGYGSGASIELIDALQTMYPSKVIIAVGVLPFNDEQFAAFDGTKKWLKELASLEVGYMLYDNNQFTDRMTPNKAARMVNKCFVDDLRVLRGEYVDRSYTGGIDERDMLTVLSVPGRIVADSMVGLEPSDVIDGSIVKTIKKHIVEESAHADMVSDKEILASAMMYTLGDEFDEFKSGIKTDVQNEFGTHVKDTTNFSDEDRGSVAIILSGLSSPNMVIDRIIKRANELGASINQKKKSNNNLFKDDESVKVKSVTAKQSFATESKIVASGGEKSREELLREFQMRKNSN